MNEVLLKTILNSLDVVGSELTTAVDLTKDEIKYLGNLGIELEEREGFSKPVLIKKSEAKDFFKPEEFMCPCCDKGAVNSKVHKALNKARAIAGVPFVLNSAYRCKKHNAEVGGSETSSHMARYAVDIKCDNSPNRYKILGGLLTAGFNRIGIADSFIHADMDPKKSPEVVWLY